MKALQVVEYPAAADTLYDWAYRLEIKGDGALAVRRGSTRYENPHPYGSKEAGWWLEGFEDPSGVYVSTL